MFFPEKISQIQSNYKVLEIGPGSSPHPRSDAFLELDFESDDDKIAQRGGVQCEAEFDGRTVYLYRGGAFPFKDNQFDYVICSHVIEHVSDFENFMSEVFRVGSGRGYVEYPMITYEYLYNFGVHLNFVKFDVECKTLRYLPKKETPFHEFDSVSAIFYRTLECGWNDLCVVNKEMFFEGVQFETPFGVCKAESIRDLVPSISLVVEKGKARKFLDKVTNKLRI